MSTAEIVSSLENAILRDVDWVRKSFMLSAADIDKANKRWRTYSLAEQKFTDTRIGGNFCINPPPQYTRSCDIKVSGINTKNTSVAGAKTYLGMGRFYSEQMDDPMQLVQMRFGMPEYNGMLSFFTSFYNADAGLLASEGRGSIFYYIGRAAGFVVALGTVMAFPLILAGGYAVNFLLRTPSSKYYYLKNTMTLYWNRVNLIANHIAVNMGIVPRVYLTNAGATVENEAIGTDDNYITYAHRLEPDLFLASGGLDIYAVANRAQRLANARYNQMLEAASTGESRTLLSRMEDYLKKLVSDPGSRGIDKALADYHEIAMGNTANKRSDSIQSRLTQDASQVQAEQAPGSETTTAPESGVAAGGTLRARAAPGRAEDGSQNVATGYGEQSGVMDFYMANRQDGSDFVGFRVDFGGPVSESFTNTVGPSSIQSKFNGASKSARDLRFDFSEGDTGFELADQAKKAVMDTVTGALASVQMSGLIALAGSAFVDIPQHWESSAAQFPTASYTMELRSWAGNKFARFLNIYVPLSCLLAGALPISSGTQSYTAPFLCELYCRGRNQIKLGMITSLQISRGAGNMGWSRDGECLGIDVSFEVTDMSSIMHCPIDSGNPFARTAGQVIGGALGAGVGAVGGSVLGPGGTVAGGTAGAGIGGFFGEGIGNLASGIFDDDNVFTDYMAVLGNLSIADQTYGLRKLALNLTRKKLEFDTYFTKAHFASAFSSYWPSRMVGHGIEVFTRASELQQRGGTN